MTTTEHAVRVARPIDEICAFLANGENDPRWRSGVLE
jgi:hypothetical protein